MLERTTLLLLLAALLTAPSRVSWADAVSDCNGSRNLEQQIKACTILIEDGNTTSGNRAIALGNRGNAYGMLRRPKEALADYAAAIALDPNDPLTFYNRANVLFDLGRWREALRDYSSAIDLNDAFPLAYFNRGLTRERLGDHIGATDDYRIAEGFDDPIAAKAKARRERLEAMRPARKGDGSGQ
jgi:tetratricopeptide (TPR) repeat protein